MESALANFPIWILIVDYILGVIMWTLIGRAALSLFLSDDTDWAFMRIWVKVTDPILKLFAFITPGFLVKPLVPLYVAWFFFMFRFYVMPWLLGYSVMGMLSFPLEGEIARGLWYLFNPK